MYDLTLERQMDIRSIKTTLSLIAGILLSVCLTACSGTRGPIRGQIPSKATATFTSVPLPTERDQILRETPTVPSQQCIEAKGELLDRAYTLPGSNSSATVRIYLPPCYSQVEHELPIAYFLHGYPQDEDHWIELGVIERYENLLSAGKIDSTVLIFPSQPAPYFTETDGGPGSFEEIFLNYAVPQIEADLSVSKDPGERAILGISRGGVWALEIGLRHPENFDIVVALSPALAYNHPRSAYDPFVIVRSATELPSNLLISVGDREPQFANEIELFAQQLKAVGIEFKFIKHEGRHEDAAWRAIMDQVLAYMGEALNASGTLVLD